MINRDEIRIAIGDYLRINIDNVIDGINDLLIADAGEFTDEDIVEIKGLIYEICEELDDE